MNWIKIKLIRQNETRSITILLVPVMQDHLAIIRAMAARDAQGAADAMAQHISNARNGRWKSDLSITTQREALMTTLTRRNALIGPA